MDRQTRTSPGKAYKEEKGRATATGPLQLILLHSHHLDDADLTARMINPIGEKKAISQDVFDRSSLAVIGLIVARGERLLRKGICKG